MSKSKENNRRWRRTSKRYKNSPTSLSLETAPKRLLWPRALPWFRKWTNVISWRSGTCCTWSRRRTWASVIWRMTKSSWWKSNRSTRSSQTLGAAQWAQTWIIGHRHRSTRLSRDQWPMGRLRGRRCSTSRLWIKDADAWVLCRLAKRDRQAASAMARMTRPTRPSR